MINESQVSFYPGGGHNHDGENSSLINTSIYSVYDFPVQIVGDPDRTADQIRNLDSFKQLIIDTVNQSIIAPSGIVFQEGIINGSAHIISRSIEAESIATGTLTANEISAGTITSDLLVSNFVLVNNVISSNNYVTGVSGWSINSDGSAEFDIAVIRGQIVAGSIFINNLNFWNPDGTFSVGAANNVMLYNGTDLELTGTVTATAGQIAGWQISGDSLVTGGNFSGDMILGSINGSAYAGMKVAGAADNGYYGEIIVDGSDDTYGYVQIAVNNDNNDYPVRTQYTAYGVIYSNYSQTQNWEFTKAGNDLYAIVDGVPYCLAQCANTTSVTTTTNSGGGTTSGTTTTGTTTTTASPAPYKLCIPIDLDYYGCTEPGQCRQGASGGPCDPNTTTTTAPPATTTAATTTTAAPPPPPPACVCCVGTAVQETRCIRGMLEYRNGVSYNGSCGASGSSGTGCSGACVGCSCPAFTEWGAWQAVGVAC